MAATTNDRRRPSARLSEAPRQWLFLHRVAHFLVRFSHLRACRLHIVELLLLFCSQQRTNLRHGVIHDRLGLLHRILMNGDDLWLGLIEDRLNLGLLITGQV